MASFSIFIHVDIYVFNNYNLMCFIFVIVVRLLKLRIYFLIPFLLWF